jgi:hypothetical protein
LTTVFIPVEVDSVFITGYKHVVMNFVAELTRTRQEMKSAIERSEHQMELQQQKMMQAEKELQLALQQEKIAHEEDVEKLVSERVTSIDIDSFI